MRDFSTIGFLTNARRTISFTIPFDKPITAQEIYFTSMNIQVRHINGGLLINGDVIQGDYSIRAEIKSLGVFVSITRSEPFDTLNDIPLSVYVVEAEWEFYSEPIIIPVPRPKTHEELIQELIDVWGINPEEEPEPDPEPEPEPSPEPTPEPEEDPEEPEEIEEEETDESESDTGSEQLHSDDEDSD